MAFSALWPKSQMVQSFPGLMLRNYSPKPELSLTPWWMLAKGGENACSPESRADTESGDGACFSSTGSWWAWEEVRVTLSPAETCEWHLVAVEDLDGFFMCIVICCSWVRDTWWSNLPITTTQCSKAKPLIFWHRSVCYTETAIFCSLLTPISML